MVMDILKETSKRFNEQYKGVRAEIEFFIQEQYKTKLPVLMAANEPPDIFMTWCAGFLEPYVKAGKVYPLDEITKQNKNE